jgi:hypothetical protein
MKRCEQFEGMSVLDHGRDVFARYLDLIGPEPKLRWRMPDWVPPLRPLQLPLETMRLYLTYHDCGKPYCRAEDADGRHFPGHAQASHDTWMRHARECEHKTVPITTWNGKGDLIEETECADDCPCVADEQVGDLILMDMDAHTAKGDAIGEFIKRPEAPSLVLAALAEIHSNASWLRQLDSDTFKIKWKQVDKLGRRLVASLRGFAVY